MKKLITEADIARLIKEGMTVLLVGESDIITPLAKDKANALRLKIVRKGPADIIAPEDFYSVNKSIANKKIVVGSDHTGFKIKNLISKVLIEKGYEIIDVGTYDETSCDYPDFALAAAKKVMNGGYAFGIIIDATGIPSAITANKLPGIRAATCYNEFSAKSAREHNNANVLVIGAKALGEETIKSILETWLITKFGGGRHQKRLDKVTAVEKQFLK